MFRRRMSRTCWCLVAALVFAAPPARADASADASDLFARARERRLAGDCASALPLFRRAYEMYPAGLGSLRNVAECEEALGRFASAHRAWLDLQRNLLTNKESKYEGWEQDAAQAAARLAPKVATLTIDVDPVTAAGKSVPNAGIEVTVNGEPLNPRLFGTPLERDSGRYVIVASSADEGVSQQRAVDLSAGEEKRVELRVTVQSPTDRATAMSERQAAPQRTAAWIAGGLGAASLVGAGVAALERQSALDDLERECGGSIVACHPTENTVAEQAKVHSIEDRGHAWATWTNVLAVVGVVGLSSGMVLYAVGRARSPHAAFLVSPQGILATGRF